MNADHDLENNWEALFVMVNLFAKFARELRNRSRAFKRERANTIDYLMPPYGQRRNYF